MINLAEFDWGKLMERAPEAACMLALGYLFIRHLTEVNRSGREERAEHAERFKKMGEDCHVHQNQIMARTERAFDKMGVVLAENTAAAKENTKALARAGH